MSWIQYVKECDVRCLYIRPSVFETVTKNIIYIKKSGKYSPHWNDARNSQTEPCQHIMTTLGVRLLTNEYLPPFQMKGVDSEPWMLPILAVENSIIYVMFPNFNDFWRKYVKNHYQNCGIPKPPIYCVELVLNYMACVKLVLN